MKRPPRIAVNALVIVCTFAVGCRGSRANGNPRASGYVEATEVRVGPQVGGRVLEVPVNEGDRLTAGAVVARIDVSDIELSLRRAHAERDQAAAQLRLLEAGARPEDVRQARAQVESAQAELQAAESELQSAAADLQRFEALLVSNAGSRKQRDDAATRHAVAAARVAAARARARAAAEALARLLAGSRAEEMAAARARVAAVEAQIAEIEKQKSDAVLTSPVSGIVTAKMVRAGELISRGTPIITVADLDAPWANVYVDEPLVPSLKLGQTVTIVTDAGQRLDGTLTFISPKAEFTPRNVQTAQERSKLVYRIKVSVDNRGGILKQGMPVEAEIVPR
jgi:HlyD family secretion protein